MGEIRSKQVGMSDVKGGMREDKLGLKWTSDLGWQLGGCIKVHAFPRYFGRWRVGETGPRKMLTVGEGE
jgi:hypothetical protein